MSIQVKRRRDTAANNAAFIGAQGEIVVDLTNMRMIVHDGATAGGFPAAKLGEVPGFASGPANEVMATPTGSSGLASLRALTRGDLPAITRGDLPAITWSDLPTPTVTGYTVSSTISAPGVHLALAAGITLTLPSPSTWSDMPLVVKDRSGAIAPNIVISGTIDGAAGGMVLRGRNNAVVLAADAARSSWQIIGAMNVQPNPIATQLLAGYPIDFGSVAGIVTVADDFGVLTGSALDVIDLGTTP